MKSYIRENDPDPVPSNKKAKCIAESIASLAKEVKESKLALREKCPNTEFFLVRIFLYLD